MNIRDLIISFLSWYPVIPAAALCLFPMKNSLKRPPGKTMAGSAVFLAAVLAAATIIDTSFHPYYNSLTPVLLVAAFAFYYLWVLDVHISKALSVFLLSCAFVGFLCNYSIGFDAFLHPASNPDDFSLEAGIFLAVLSSLSAVLLFRPLSRYGSELIDEVNTPRAWYSSLPVSVILLVFCIVTIPHKYETLYVNKVFRAYLVINTLFFILLLLVCVAFYYIVSGMSELSRIRERNHILEMQETQYHKQERYFKEMQKARHDFKHTVNTVNNLVLTGDKDALLNYLKEAMDSLPKNELTNYCPNMAVNAILNYYREAAEEGKIRLNWDVSIPDPLPVSDVDLCSILGNILENAVTACSDVPEEERFIDLSISVDHGAMLYIVATNSFSEEFLNIKNGHYVSTHKGGTGIGLSSVISTAEHYGGIVGFSHEKSSFMSDIMIPVSGPR